jgi:hypothetical protein
VTRLDDLLFGDGDITPRQRAARRVVIVVVLVVLGFAAGVRMQACSRNVQYACFTCEGYYVHTASMPQTVLGSGAPAGGRIFPKPDDFSTFCETRKEGQP